MRRYDPDGREPSEQARWKLGGAAPALGCLAMLIALLLLIAGAAWWVLS